MKNKLHLNKLAIGLMSGTSLDGLDIALVELEIAHKKLLDIKLLKFETYSFDTELKQEIFLATLDKACTRQICNLNFKFSYFCASKINEFLSKNNYLNKDIDFIASHGQTIYHLVNDLKDNEIRSTFQIGDGNIIANLTSINTVSDFRPSDIAMGGYGAPLICLYDLFLAKKFKKNFLFQNIGGIANVTVIVNKDDNIISFDNGPGNMMINYLSNKFFNQEYDDEGKMASLGIIDLNLLNFILEDDYYALPPPKTTGREKYNSDYVDNLIKYFPSINKHDFIRTITFLTAKTIVDSYKNFIDNNHSYDLVISGGGIHNKLLINDIKKLLPSNIVISDLDSNLFNADAKEAMGFVLLGYSTLNKLPSNILSATGAKQKAILGKICYVK